MNRLDALILWWRLIDASIHHWEKEGHWPEKPSFDPLGKLICWTCVFKGGGGKKMRVPLFRRPRLLTDAPLRVPF